MNQKGGGTITNSFLYWNLTYGSLLWHETHCMEKSFYKFKGFMKEWPIPVNAVFFENVIASDYF